MVIQLECSIMFVNMNTLLVAIEQWNVFEVYSMCKPVELLPIIISQVAGFIKKQGFGFKMVTDY